MKVFNQQIYIEMVGSFYLSKEMPRTSTESSLEDHFSYLSEETPK